MKVEILPSSVLRHILLLTLFLNTMECTGSASSDAEYEQEVMDFRQRRVKFLKSEKKVWSGGRMETARGLGTVRVLG